MDLDGATQSQDDLAAHLRSLKEQLEQPKADSVQERRRDSRIDSGEAQGERREAEQKEFTTDRTGIRATHRARCLHMHVL